MLRINWETGISVENRFEVIKRWNCPSHSAGKWRNSHRVLIKWSSCQWRLCAYCALTEWMHSSQFRNYKFMCGLPNGNSFLWLPHHFHEANPNPFQISSNYFRVSFIARYLRHVVLSQMKFLTSPSYRVGIWQTCIICVNWTLDTHVNTHEILLSPSFRQHPHESHTQINSQ